MKITVNTGNIKDPMQWAVVGLIRQYEQETEYRVSMSEGCRNHIDVECTVDGVSIDFEALVKSWLNSFECAVEERAKELLIEEIGGLESRLSNMKETLEEASDEMMRKFWSKE